MPSDGSVLPLLQIYGICCIYVVVHDTGRSHSFSTSCAAAVLALELCASALQIPIALAPIWLLYGYVAPVLDEYVGDAATRDAK